MISVFGWPDPNTGFNQSEHALYTCYFVLIAVTHWNLKNISQVGSFDFMYGQLNMSGRVV